MTQTKGRKSPMLIPTIVMGVLAVGLLLVGYSKGQGQHVAGLSSALDMTLEILPMLVFAFVVAGMIQVLVPRELLLEWVGVESGLRGLLIGTAAGSVAYGGPYVVLPTTAALLRAGASAGTMVAFITGWSLWAVSRLPMEVGLLGWKFTLVRVASTFFFPPIAGWLAQMLFSAAK